MYRATLVHDTHCVFASSVVDAAKPPKPKSDSGGKGGDDEDSLGEYTFMIIN